MKKILEIKRSFNEVWAYRGFVLGSVRRNFDLTYRNSTFGAIWTILNPLAMIFVYTIVFSQIMQAKLPGVDSSFGYSIYLCTGILVWGLFVEIANNSKSVFIDNAGLLKKIYFPKLCLPIIVLLSALLNFSIIFSLFLFFLILTDNFPGIIIFDILPLLALVVALAIGLGFSVGVINVFFRDAGHIFNILLTFWFWLTPIVYTANIIPDDYRIFIEINPMTSVVQGFQRVLVNGVNPQWLELLPSFLFAILVLLLALFLYQKLAYEMVDEL